MSYQNDVTLQSWSSESHFGLHDKHLILFHCWVVCTNPSTASHNFHFVDNDGSPMNTVLSKQWQVIVDMNHVVVSKVVERSIFSTKITNFILVNGS